MLNVKHLGLVVLMSLSCTTRPKPKVPERVVISARAIPPRITHSNIDITTLEALQKNIISVTYPAVITEPEQIRYTSADKRLARKIMAWKKRIDHNRWFECGRRYTEEEIPEAAIEWAHAINRAHRSEEAQYTLRKGKHTRVDIREATGIIINESRFDRCGVGPYPRKFAYQNGMLKRNRLSLSHSLEELEAVFKHPKFAGKKADLGPGQIVRRIGKGKKSLNWEEAKEYLTVVPGVQKVFTEMARRGQMYRTRTPSSYWPGSKKSPTYTFKVLRRATALFDGKIHRRYQTYQFSRI